MRSDSAYSPSTSQQVTLSSDVQDHRKRRRNRTRVSCLNCYASKRKCDRKRPCTRCVKHGLTGLCVYELDDPTERDRSHLDEKTRLKYRIAELESTIREMNNRPHPRWTAPGGVVHDPAILRRGPQRRVKAQNARSSSVDAFFAAIADTEDRNMKVKLELDAFVPEFTPSDIGSPLTPLSALSSVSSTSPAPMPCDPFPTSPISAPFTSGDRVYSDGPEARPTLSSFHKSAEKAAGDHACQSSRPSTTEESQSPAVSDSFEDGPSLANVAQHDRDPATLSFNFPLPNGTPSFLPELSQRAEIGTQTTPVRSRSPSVIRSEPSPHLVRMQADESNCRCLVDPTVYSPLVFFASSLRTSREALEALHPANSNCVLFRRILELDDHIFSASPPTPPMNPKAWPVPDLDDTLYSASEPTLTPSSPSPHNPLYSPIRHPHSHALPFYSHPSPPACPLDHHQYIDPASHRVLACGSDAQAYFADSSVYQDWI